MRTFALVVVVWLLSCPAIGSEPLKIVPAYTGSVDDLIVLRSSWRDSCLPDVRPSRMGIRLAGNVLSIRFLHVDTSAGACAFAFTPYQAAWTFRELGLTELPDRLTIEIAETNVRTEFRREPGFRFRSRIDPGWWKAYWLGSTVSIDRQGDKIGFLVLAHAPTGESVWRATGGAFGAGGGRFELYQTVRGETLGGEYIQTPLTTVDGELQFAFEGPALLWMRYGAFGYWREYRPYYFGVAQSTRRWSSPSLAGSWEVDGAGGRRLAVNIEPEIPPFENFVEAYRVSVGGARGRLRCEFDGCRFAAGLEQPLGGLLIPWEGMTRDAMSVRSPLGWSEVLVRER